MQIKEIVDENEEKIKPIKSKPKRKIERINQIEACKKVTMSNLEIPIKIEGKKLMAILDTGSNLTLINDKLIDSNEEIESTNVSLQCANDSEIKVKGEIDKKISIYEKEYKAKMCVTHGLNSDVILGINFMVENAAVIDFKRKNVQIGTGKHAINVKMDDNWIQHFELKRIDLINDIVTSLTDITLEPKSKKILVISKINVDRQLKEDEQVIVTPVNGTSHKTGIRVHGGNDENGQMATIELYNYTNTTRKIYAGQKVGQVRVSKQYANNLPDQRKNDELQESDEIRDNDGHVVQISKKLTTYQRRQAIELISRYKHLFTMNSLEISKANVEEYELKVKDDEPVVSRSYKLAPVERREIWRQINAMEKAGILKRSRSNYSSPAFLVKKSDKNYRFICNFQKLNEKLIPDRNAVPRVGNILMALEGAKYFNLLDCNSGFHQIPIKEDCRYLTAIVIDNQLFEFTRLPQGLMNSPAAFSKIINTEFSDLLYEEMVAYMDDICSYGKTFEIALKSLEKTFARLAKLNLKLKTSKCKFFYDEIELLGHKVNGSKIEPVDKNVKAVQNFPRPTTVKQVQSFIGMCSHYRRFIKNFAHIASSLSELTKGDVTGSTKVKWKEEHEAAFQKLKTLLTSAPVLGIYKEDRITIVETDASSIAVGGVLSQQDEKTGKTHPVAYFSRKLQPRQKKYCAYDLELTALVETITHFREYLFGLHFTVYTDHSALIHYRKMKEPSSRMARMILKLSEYDFEIKHKPGKSNVVPDVLSRTEIPAISETEIGNVNEILTGKDEINFQNEQEKDEFCKNLMLAKQGKLDKSTNGYKKYTRKCRRYEINENGILVFNQNTPYGKNKAIVIPQHLVTKILEIMHDNAVGGGHFGANKTLEKIRNKYYWTGMIQDIKNYIQTCHSCQMNKKEAGKIPGLLKPLKIDECELFIHLVIDFVGPLPKSAGNEYILVGTCRATKFALAKPVSKASAESVIKFLYEIISIYGCPKKISCDNGTHFKNADFQNTCKQLGIKLQFSSTYCAASQGGTEKFNHTLCKSLTHYTNEKRNNWSDYVKFVVFSYNTTPVTRFNGLSPYFILYGQQPNLPEENKLGINTKQKKDRSEEIRELRKIREEIPALIYKNQMKDKNRYDQTHKEVEYKEGDLILIENPWKHQGKFSKKYNGPYKVLKKLSPLNYEIDVNGKIEIVHVRRTKQYKSR